MALDFPNNPATGDNYVTPSGVIYTWSGYAWARNGLSSPSSPGNYVLKAGDAMTGPLILNADPSSSLGAVTKQYVDTRSALPTGGNVGEALVINPGALPAWGAPIDGGIF
jgi:hypothetical protein